MCNRCASDAHQVNVHSCEHNRSGLDAHQGAHVVSLFVYKDGDWLQLGTAGSDRFDSINTLVMHRAIGTTPIPVGDHEVLTALQYPVHSSQYYKQRSSHRV